jgi:hypothetical protein
MSQSAVAFLPTSELAQLGVFYSERSVRARKLASQARQAQDVADKMLKEYESAWLVELERRQAERKLSTCTHCDKVFSTRTLKPALASRWKSENYGPEFFHTLTAHRACGRCREHLDSFAMLSQLQGRACFFEDKREERPAFGALERLAARLEMPPAAAELRSAAKETRLG